MPPIQAHEIDIPLPVPARREPLSMRFCRIPAGEFWMGSRGYSFDEEPRHRVVIPEDFWLGKYVVTQAEWEALVAACEPAVVANGTPKPLAQRPSGFQGDRRPVEQVSWHDCLTWCTAWQDWLRRERPTEWYASWEVVLPSEAQWEYACRARSDTEYWNGDGEAALEAVGWFDGNSGGTTHDVDEPVVAGSPEQHPFGLVGMHGNVWEWCADAYDSRAYRKREDGWTADMPWGKAQKHGATDLARVFRGGSWRNTAWRCRSACRNWFRPGIRIVFLGFRVCLVRGPVSQTGGGAAAATERAEAEQAEQDKASGTRPQSSAAGKAGAGQRARGRTTAARPEAQPRGREKMAGAIGGREPGSRKKPPRSKPMKKGEAAPPAAKPVAPEKPSPKKPAGKRRRGSKRGSASSRKKPQE